MSLDSPVESFLPSYRSFLLLKTNKAIVTFLPNLLNFDADYISVVYPISTQKMGRILVGKCRKCGYKTETLYFGSGRCDNNEVCNYPALDNAQHKVIRANIMKREEKQLIKPNIIFYDDDSLNSRKLDPDKACYRWGDYILFVDGNYCPHCQEYELRFDSIGLYD